MTPSSSNAIARLVLASNNRGKLAELTRLLAPLGVTPIGQADFGVPEVAEPHGTFLENALTKARHASALSGLPAMADDSGLCVDALGGAPGVASAHWAVLDHASDGNALAVDAGPVAREALRRRQDGANNRRLLQALGHVTDRHARFVCTLVALRSADDAEPLVAFGRWEGQVLQAPRGDAGFGYDPLLWIPELSCSVAELPAEVKNAHSHRALAVRQMLQLMRGVWRIG